MNIPSYVLQPGQEISLKEKAQKNQIVIMGEKNPRLELPDFLKKYQANGQTKAKVLFVPDTQVIPFNCNTGLFTEYYAARKA